MGAPRYSKSGPTGIAARGLLVIGLCVLACPSAAEAPRARLAPSARSSAHRADKKQTGPTQTARPWFATVIWVHDGTTLALSAESPTEARFQRLVADRISGEAHAMAPELLALLRTVGAAYPGARIELVSGFRSPKFNEMLRKKGHKVANQSQHSDGHAVDFRIIPVGQTDALDPFDVEIWLRKELHWEGGIGVYPTRSDRFVHADVGKNRRWISR